MEKTEETTRVSLRLPRAGGRARGEGCVDFGALISTCGYNRDAHEQNAFSHSSPLNFTKVGHQTITSVGRTQQLAIVVKKSVRGFHPQWRGGR